MGIVNVSPDSFSDGCAGPDAAAAIAAQHLAAGATWIDVGGESTRPGAGPVTAEAELGRIVPAIRAIRASCHAARISIDTSKAAVAAAALGAGADAVNDVTAGSDPDMLRLAAERHCPVVLMHSRGTPATMQGLASYSDVVIEVAEELAARIAAALAAGIAASLIIADPGIGFAKTAEHNLRLLAGLDRLRELLAARCGFTPPLLVGLSRKSFLAKAAGVDWPPAQRDGLSHIIHAAVADRCAVLRVHDVAGAAAAIRLAAALRQASDREGPPTDFLGPR
ncbi:dihydropteroate synthase [Planctomycetota bacterium]|nr:dihydropteroate synthase [Planctomycetota bacterium]